MTQTTGYGGETPPSDEVRQIVYILKCNDGTFYVGCTQDLTERLNRHTKGQIHYTASRLPVKLTTSVSFNDKYKAFAFEKYLKSGSGRAFAKKRLI